MFNHNIFKLLREFSKPELKAFERFVDSPYYNKSNKVKRLFIEIKKFHPDFLNKKLTKEYLSKKINPSLKYHDSTLRDLMSDLLLLLEEFLIMEEFKKDRSEKDIFLLKSLIDKNQNILFEKHLKRLNNEIEDRGIDSSYFYNRSRIELNKFNFNIINRHKKSSAIIEGNEEILISYLIQLLNHFVTESINAYLNLSIYESKFKLRKNKNIVSGLFKNSKILDITKSLKNVNKYNFILDIYFSLLRAFENIENEKNYDEYKLLVLKHSKQLSNDEMAYHFSMLISYCLYKISSGQNNSKFDSELFELYEIFLKGKYFIDSKTKYLEEDLFRDILLISLRLKKYNWVLHFIKTYSDFLHPEKKKNILNLSYSEYYISQTLQSVIRNKNKAFNHLKEIKDESFIVKYDVKSLYLMLYFDLNYDESAIIQLNNYRKFLRRNRFVTKNKKIKIDKFLNVYEKLVYLREKDYRIDISEVHSDILISQNLEHRDWLLTKIEEIESNIHSSKQFLAGVVCRGKNTDKFFIENSIEHSQIIVDDLKKKMLKNR